MRRLLGQPPLIRSVNRAIILEAVQRLGPTSRAELAKKCGLSAPTVSKVVADLVAEGLLVEKGFQSTNAVGRNPVVLEFNPRAACVAAIDLSRTPPVGALVDLNGDVEQEQVISAEPLRGENVVPRLVRFIMHLVEEAFQHGTRLVGVGIGIPGVVSHGDNGDTVWAPGLGLRQFPLRDTLMRQMALDVPVLIENDVNLAVLGESWKGAGAGRTNLVLVAAAEGIGAGMILDGKLYRGANGAAGEIGYFNFERQSPDSQFFRGPLEDAISIPSFLTRAAMLSSEKRGAWSVEDRLPITTQELSPVSFPTVEDVFQAADAGDAGAREACEELTGVLARALANVACVLNPELIILGGEYSVVRPWFVEKLREDLKVSVPYPPQVKTARLGRSSVLVGISRYLLSEESRQLTLAPF